MELDNSSLLFSAVDSVLIIGLIFQLSLISMGFLNRVVCDSGCPNPKLLDPCTCNHSIIVCGGEQNIDLEKIFDKLNTKLKGKRKYFDEILINNTAVTQLTDNMFKDLKFNTIFIDKAINLKKIHPNAFNGSIFDTKIFVLQKCKNFDSLELFDVLNNFVNIETINIENTKIAEIPTNAFKTHQKLYSIAIKGKSIAGIGPKAFHPLRVIKFIDIFNTSISKIGENIFAFEKSDIKVHIKLFNNRLDGSSFMSGAFENIGRPAQIHFMSSYQDEISAKLEFLNQDVFEPFFKANQSNYLILRYYLNIEVIDCNDCRNVWLKNNLKFSKRIWPLTCSNNDSFYSPDNFKTCRT